MIKPLRKRHRQVWMIAALLLPIGIILSWLVIPDQQPVKLLQDQSMPLLPVIIKTKKTDSYTISIRSNKENTKWQLEWVNKKALTVPSAVIYRLSFPLPHLDTTEFKIPVNGNLIGRIEARGRYVFPLTPDSSATRMNFVLYDFIHYNIIEKINLSE